MNIVDLLVTIVVVTILVTIVLAIVTYIAYKLRLAREPNREELDDGPRYFIPYQPPTPVSDGTGGDGAVRTADGHRLANVAVGRVAPGSTVARGVGVEGHAAEA